MKNIIPSLIFCLGLLLALGIWGKFVVDIAVDRAVQKVIAPPLIQAEDEILEPEKQSLYAPEQMPKPGGDWNQSWESTRD